MALIFKDRKSVYPNRYKVTPTEGESYYVYLERADEPTTVGTPLNAETFNTMVEELLQQGGISEIVSNEDGTLTFIMTGGKTFTTPSLKVDISTKAPVHTWSTEDILAGSASTEPEGTLHLVIE